MFATNDRVRVTQPYYGEIIGGWGRHENVNVNEEGYVTRAYGNSSLVRFNYQFTLSVPNDKLELVSAGDPSAPARPAARKPGVKPEGDEFLDPRDPRLEWFWDDVSAYAERSSYCEEFDRILTALNLPARKRQYIATGRLGGLTVSTTFMAHSQQEANELLVDQLAAEVEKAVAEQKGEGE